LPGELIVSAHEVGVSNSHSVLWNGWCGLWQSSVDILRSVQDVM